jgi:hypothetical protein
MIASNLSAILSRKQADYTQSANFFVQYLWAKSEFLRIAGAPGWLSGAAFFAAHRSQPAASFDYAGRKCGARLRCGSFNMGLLKCQATCEMPWLGHSDRL